MCMACQGDKVQLVRPAATHARQARAMVAEFAAAGDKMWGGSGLDEAADYDEWLDRVRKNTDAATVESGRMPSEQYFIMRESDGLIVGVLVIRRTLNERLMLFGGHVGYSVRPTERRKGYASKALQLAVENLFAGGAPEVLVMCDEDNIASRKTIEHCGGVYLGREIDDQDAVLRFGIPRTKK